MIKVIQTTKERNKKWRAFNIQEEAIGANLTLPLIRLDPKEKYQTILGFGGAFTEAACLTIMASPPAIRAKIMAMYFSEKGLAYNLGRTVIHSCDFAFSSYTYIKEGAKDLESFDISHEEQYVIPVIKDALHIAKNGLRLLATPWSPPAFMKTNNSMLNGGSLRLEYRQMWAEYIVKYVTEMQKRAINIEFLSIQNEPEAVQTWESCIMSAREEGEFISDYLYPALAGENLSNIKLLIWDHNRDRIIERARETFQNRDAFNLIWGIGYHWYVSDAHENLTVVHNLFPTKHLLFTEGCVEFGHYSATERKDPNIVWEHGQRYGRHMINDFNNFNEGWIDWNLVLDERGGPNHVGNYCEAPLMYDRNNQQIIVNASYYFIGHFSRYVVSGAQRIACTISEPNACLATAFINPDGTVVCVISNEKEQKDMLINILNRYIKITLPRSSITTIII